MGSIIIVPPIQMIETHEPNMAPIPVMFSGSYGNMTAQVVPQPPVKMQNMYDPMQAYHQLYSFHTMGTSNYNQAVNRRRNSSYISSFGPIIHTLTLDAVNEKFWDKQELIDIVKAFAGDLLLQICPAEARWNFAVADQVDASALQQLMMHQKSHKFEVDPNLRPLVKPWLTEHVTEFDHICDSRTNTTTKDAIFIRNDVEAIHFKMRWFGKSAEDEGIEVEEDVPF